MTDYTVHDYLRDISDAAKKIEDYTEEMSFDAFKDDDMTVDAVL